MKVQDLPYKRITAEELIEKIQYFTAKVSEVKTAQELANLRKDLLTEVYHFTTMFSLANCRFTLNTKDEFYSTEKEYYDEAVPKVDAEYVKFIRAFLNSIHIKEVAYYLNPLVIKKYDLNVKVINDKVVPLLIRENKLVTSYTRLMAETMFEYEGSSLPFATLKKYFNSPDREIRKKAYEAAGNTLQTISDKLDTIFDNMVHLRHEIALELGYDNFVQLGDDRMGRYSYSREMITKFRENVKKDIVPVVKTLKNSVSAALNLPNIMLYDNETYFKDGTPSPILTPTQIFEAGKEMYENMNAETGEFFNMMLKNDAFDVFPRDGKWGGGYCTSFADYKQPFILANFNGTASDIDVLTHEAGHALADYLMYKQEHDLELNVGGMETAEVHSMSMEFLCWKYMQNFFGERAIDYKYSHLADALTFIPYGVIVDYFQELCYLNPSYTPQERNDLWLKLENEYRPYLSAQGIPYLEKGTRWQYQMHIYESPLYYIDYCLAQSVALQFLIESQKNYNNAFSTYLEFLKSGGEKDFNTLCLDAGLKSPFSDGALSPVADACSKLLKSMDKKLLQNN